MKTKRTLVGIVIAVVIIAAAVSLVVKDKERIQAHVTGNVAVSASSTPLVLQTVPTLLAPSSAPLIATSSVSSAPVSTSNARSASGLPTVNGIQFEIVTTPAAQQQGLGGRSTIPDNYAMLFVFPTDNTYGFWMKDMLVPIDMIWLSNLGQIIFIDHSVLPSSYPNVFYPPQPVKYVLETRAGYANEKNWVVGTMITLPAPY